MPRPWGYHHVRLKAHQRANHIIRCFVSGDTHLLVRAFIVYVRPLLECNSDVSASFLCLSCPALVLVLIMCVSSCSVDFSKINDDDDDDDDDHWSLADGCL